MIFNSLMQKDISVDEKKGFISPVDWSTSFPDWLSTGGDGDLSAWASISLYKKCMPLFNAISLRAETVAQIPIRVWDTSKKEFLEDHPALELLKNPNADVSQTEFMEQLASYYDITGETFLAATGRLENPPLELSVLAPPLITFGTGTRFSFLNVPDRMWFNNQVNGQTTFKADELKTLGLRFINQEKDRELWHIRSFNPDRSSTNFRGMSRAKPLWFEIQQYISGNTTNLSMLKRGTRLSMAWVNNKGEELTETQWSRLREQAEKYAGDANAGGTPILDGMDVKNIQQTNRDMEFKESQEAMLARISTTYRIPLALLLSQSMTLNNLETSMLQLFDGATLPLAKRLFEELTRFVLRRYPDSENLEFRFNENDIPALRLRMIETAKSMSEINVNTINEIRAVIGGVDIAGGDVVLRPATLIPVSENDLSDQINTESKLREDLKAKGMTTEEIDSLIADTNLGL